MGLALDLASIALAGWRVDRWQRWLTGRGRVYNSWGLMNVRRGSSVEDKGILPETQLSTQTWRLTMPLHRTDIASVVTPLACVVSIVATRYSNSITKV